MLREALCTLHCRSLLGRIPARASTPTFAPSSIPASELFSDVDILRERRSNPSSVAPPASVSASAALTLPTFSSRCCTIWLVDVLSCQFEDAHTLPAGERRKHGAQWEHWVHLGAHHHHGWSICCWDYGRERRPGAAGNGQQFLDGVGHRGRDA